ncbi:putative uncharacterized protein [Parachlamydia acanthamoebae UV-7]|uniref:Uncharacterized protein n=2 Tax=Parachlamydia acanthamoebae TaxID=83552 RepID=F8KWY3_PARAV|nr:hypothetical protein DB43_GE00090 [Parachlamydia acanthamoebae]CCB86723.1 putative uncharacterized protein [Parachlamydia acanthamoebae UV-7]
MDDLRSQRSKIADDHQRVADQEQKIIDQSIVLKLPTEIRVPACQVFLES